MERFVTEKSKDYSLLDNHTGEILELKKTRKVSIDEFMIIFLSSYSDMLALTGMQLKILMCCWRHSSYNDKNCSLGNLVHNNQLFKDYCRKDGLNASNASIDNALSQLAFKGFLIKKCRGTYLLNPTYFFKGTLSDRSKVQYNIMLEPNEEQYDKTLYRMNASNE